jgi:hypothetical protein
MFSLSPSFDTHPETVLRERRSPSPDPVSCPALVATARPSAGCRHHREASYWLGGANEMAAINTILIIVNSAAR